MNFPALTPANILIVDDTPDNLSILSSILNQHGYKVRPALRGDLALKAAQALPPDLILLDINMPQMSGYEVCRQLKGNPQTSGIPIIFISALDDANDKVKAFDLGGIDYITKPFQIEEVLARIELHLTLSQQRQQLIKQKQEIESLSQLKDQLISTLSHDLKNPIGVILGMSRLLLSLEGLVNDPIKSRELLESIHRNAEKMFRLVSDLLDLSRIERGMPLVLQSVCLYQLVDQQISNVQELVTQKFLTLILDCPEPEATIQGDPQQLEQVINNLLSNAIKYTPEQGSITIKILADADWVRMTIQDTGLGIPERDLPHIFEKFYRVNSEKHAQVEGTGLGLSIVKAIVDQHQGKIEVESNLGHGTSFHVMLPKNLSL
ncbi:MAG: hybrid sensor histidine kinase/response regulator [Cyanobacteriota bacterium]|nr:hybrid sensor histidine kinase/response regulator [Cyanobacteriota bacterium]